MTATCPQRRRRDLLRALSVTFSVWTLLIGCDTPNPRQQNLPPSETDLVLLKPGTLCQRKSAFLQQHPQSTFTTKTWGTGQELVISGDRSASHGDESYFFDEDGTLVGTLFTFSSGLDLAPYSVLRHTLTLLKPTLEFYLTVANFSGKANMDSSSLFETGDEKTTTQYLVISAREHPTLLQASVTIDPYVKLFSPYRREFLSRLRQPSGNRPGQQVDSQGAEDKEPFPSLQQFARGQTAQLSYCSTQQYDIAADAYRKSLASGFTSKVWLAEAHHKLGQSLYGLEQYELAKTELLQSLAIRPNAPEILNSLGSTQVKLGDKAGALASFEKAVSLRPNLATARFNLAELLEPTNPKRALSEYETYLVLVEGIPEEADRIALAQQRVKKLKPPK